MGKPIKIIDLAKTLISFYNEKIEIKTTEIRPGEKLNEEIISSNEILEPTKYKDVLLKNKKVIIKLKPNI